MIKKLRYLCTLLLIAVASAAWGAEELFYTLNGTITGGTNGYATESEITQGDISWKIMGNTTASPWRIGGKSLTNENRTAYSTTAMGSAISRLVLTLGTGADVTINSLELIVASNADFTNVLDKITKTEVTLSGDNVFIPSNGSEWASGAYYKFVFNLTITATSNKFVQFSALKFYRIPSANQVATPTFSPVAGTYAGSQEITISTTTEGATIYYTTDGTDPTTNSSVYSNAIKINDDTTIKALAAKEGFTNSTIASASYTIVNIEHAGTVADPYTVADARAAIDAGIGTTDVYATGIVSAIPTAYSSQYSNITFNFVDEEGNSEYLQAYRCVGDEAANVQVGDIVVVNGNLTKYNSTYEFDAACKLVSLKHPTSTDPSITAENVNIEYDATSGVISYTIENEPDPVGTLTASVPEGSWITLGTVGETVPFTCAANTASAPRTATVTLTYTYGDSQSTTKEVTVTQTGNPNVENNISDITKTGTYNVKGTIVAKSQRGFIVGDGTGYVYYYNKDYAQADYKIGDIVNLSGDVSVYGGVYQYTSTATISTASESNYVAEDPIVLTGSQMDERVASTTPPQLSSYVQYQGTLSISDTHYNITNIDGATKAQGSISYPLSTDFTDYNGKTVKVTGYYVGISSSQYYNTMIGSIEEVIGAAPIISAENITLEYNAEFGEIEYTINNPVVGKKLEASSTSDWISNVTVTNDKVTFTCTVNEGTKDRTATITLSYEGAEDKEVTVTQKYHVVDYATLPFEFDGGKADIENTDGLTHEGIDTDYGSSPKLKFNTTDDYLLLHFNERPGKLTFDIKGNSFSGGTFKVQTSEDGTTYTDLETYTTLGDTQSEEFNNLGENVRYIKWIYTNKVSGNVALGNIMLAKYVAPSKYTLTVTNIDNGTISASYGDEILTNGDNAKVESGTEIAVGISIEEGYQLESITAAGAEEGQTVELKAVPNTVNAWTFNMPDFDVTISAIVTEYVAPSGDDYELFTEDLVEGDYIIYYDGKAMKNTVANDRLEYEEVTPMSDVITTDNTAIVWHIAKSGDYWTIYNSAANAYAASTGAKNKAQLLEDGTNDKALWTVSGTETYEFVNKANAAAGVNANLRNNGTYGFACYATSTGGALSLYKKAVSTKKGDVNNDGHVNVADVTALVNALKKGEKPEEGDIDGENGVNAEDVRALVEMILSNNNQ